jgi:hypothetical protein
VAGGGGSSVLTLLVEQRSTFSENKNFSDKRISNEKKMKTALLHFSPPPRQFPCMSLVLSNMRVKSRRHHMGPETVRMDFNSFRASCLYVFLSGEANALQTRVGSRPFCFQDGLTIRGSVGRATASGLQGLALVSSSAPCRLGLIQPHI